MKKNLKFLSGILLIFMGFGLIVALAFPALSDSKNAGRSEKRLSVDFPFLQQENSDLILVYFGYVGCTRVCTPALHDLAEVYRESKMKNPIQNLSVWFVNMTPAMDPLSVQSWATHFNSDFKSYAPNESELETMVHTLSLVYSDLGVEAEHMPYAYLFKKTTKGYELVYIYTSSPYNRALILKDIGALL